MDACVGSCMNYRLYREVGRIREMVVVAVQKRPWDVARDVTLPWSTRSDHVIAKSKRCGGRRQRALRR